MSMTPNGQAAMQARHPLQTSDWITTVSNSVRMMAPVGHTSRHPAWTQCLHTSLIINQRPSRSEEHTSELQSRLHLVCRLLLEKKKKRKNKQNNIPNVQTDVRTNRDT